MKTKPRKTKALSDAKRVQAERKGIMAQLGAFAQLNTRRLQAGLDKMAEIVRAFTPPGKRAPDATVRAQVKFCDVDRANIDLLLQKLGSARAIRDCVKLEERKAIARKKERDEAAAKEAARNAEADGAGVIPCGDGFSAEK